jgi:hypothetical protein
LKKLIVSHNAGFYSCCSERLRAICSHINNYRNFPIVDSSNQWIIYKDDLNQDITDIFFENPHESEDCNLSDIETDDLQFRDYSKITFDKFTPIINRYFSPSPMINQMVSYLKSKYLINPEKTISVCYRGNDKIKETNLPSYQEMLNVLIAVKENFPDHRILVQSDEVEFYKFIFSNFPDSIQIEEVLKMHQNNKTSIPYHIPVGQRVYQAKIFHSIMLIISQCSNVIINSGNIGLWICLYRKNTNGVYQLNKLY